MLGGTEVRSRKVSHDLTEGVGFRNWVCGDEFVAIVRDKRQGGNGLRSCGLHKTASRSSSFKVSRFGIGRNEGICGESKSMVDKADAF